MKDHTTIEISMPDGRTTGPIPAKEFSLRVKEGLKKMASKEDEYADKPDYWRDTGLDKLAEEVRIKHHEHLHDAEIVFLMTKKVGAKGGVMSYGKAKLATGLTKYFSRADFIITITAQLYDQVDPKKRRAMVDHELCHCAFEEDKDGNRSWVIRRHDIEEFTSIVDRHGLWQEQHQEFGQAVARQLELGLERPEKKTEAKAAPVQ